jgi:methylmalonyl-CoA mutase cobalamin-binding domain/chain
MKSDLFLMELKQALIELDMDKSIELVNKVILLELKPMKILEVLRSGMVEVGRKFEEGEYFISELIMAGELMKKNMEVLESILNNSKDKRDRLAKIVIGTIIGDLHDIGKDILKSLLICYGFEVYDLGVDVSPEEFVEKTVETGAKIIGISALLSSSISNTSKVVKSLNDAGIRNVVKVIVGGAAARPWMVERYGVDAAVNDVVKGLDIIKKWVNVYELA